MPIANVVCGCGKSMLPNQGNVEMWFTSKDQSRTPPVRTLDDVSRGANEYARFLIAWIVTVATAMERLGVGST